MAIFVHITTEDSIPLIRRNGIRAKKVKLGRQSVKGIYAVPVVPDFVQTHQWMREIRRFKSGRLVGIYFKIEDDEQVYFGRYNQEQKLLTSNETIAETLAEPCMGIQVIVPRSIAPSAIKRVKSLPQTVGWRFYPEAKGRTPCGCKACQRGDINSRRIRDKYDAD